ncbi:hypothetical protein CFC21_054490 [Triticum aestivum]|uniref:Cathepsin propeptide inhibitor domain-containing protein n=2 Tax=Triticum aestivum TaxID=4565 RepID=A0A9R1GD54_WHEAT|nr:uncharacterized protein LOC123082862 [Triticum aestivum]KAF7045378.1 hypothetical protein CFC21_054490 [Triticum aestivum]
MSLRRSVGSLLARRFSPRPRATPRTAPARSVHSLKDFPIAHGIGRAAVVAAAALASAGALAHQYFRKGPADDESAPRGKEEDLKAMFEDWAKKQNRTYRDEEEKAMRFQVFKDNVDWIESLPPSIREKSLPLNCFADFKPEERPLGRSGQCCIIDIDGHGPDAEEEYLQNKFLAENENGEAFVWKPAMKQGDKQATHVSA